MFCSAPLGANRSNEHVFPRWLLAQLGANTTVIASTHVTPAGSTTVTREHPADRLVNGRVCRDCNNGWMSLLEIQARPILTRLLDEVQALSGLRPGEDEVLARWVAKSAFALNTASDFESLAPTSHHSAVVAGTSLPPGLHCFASGHISSQVVGWLQTRETPIVWPATGGPKPERLRRAADKSYKIGLQLGGLMLVVFFWPDPADGIAIWPSVHMPIWPPGYRYDRIEHLWVESGDGLPKRGSLDLLRQCMDTIQVWPQNPAI